MLANNDAGSSEYSEQMQFSTRLDVSQLPAPDHVQFEQAARQVDFHVVRSDIAVVGALEVRSVDVCDDRMSVQRGIRLLLIRNHPS